MALAQEQVGEQVSPITKVVGKEGLVIPQPTTIVGDKVSTQCPRIVAKHTLFAVLLQTEIDDTLRVVVLKARELGHIALLVNDLYLLDHFGRDILGGSLHVVAKELLAVYADALDLLAVDGHFALFVHLHAVHLLEQFLDGGSFADLVGSGVILYGIALDGHLGCFALHTDFGKVLHLFDKANNGYIQMLVGHLYLFG